MPSAPRFHLAGIDPGPAPVPGGLLKLPAETARHLKVLRLAAGASIVLFDGSGGEFEARIEDLSRDHAEVRVEAYRALEREVPARVSLAFSMPANERMDNLIEKAVELGAAAIQPLVSERSVLRLSGERAERRTRHWRGVAIAACEQSGRNRVPTIADPRAFEDWLANAVPAGRRILLSLDTDAVPLAELGPDLDWVLLSGPEGGLTSSEIALARQAGFEPVSLGPRVLRADTAPLAALAYLSIRAAAAG